MSAFDNSEYETVRQQYENEAKQRWGDTDAYKESQAKTGGYSKDKWNDVLSGMNGIFAEFAERMAHNGSAVIPLRSSLPKHCHSVSPSTGELIRIDRDNLYLEGRSWNHVFEIQKTELDGEPVWEVHCHRVTMGKTPDKHVYLDYLSLGFVKYVEE